MGVANHLMRRHSVERGSTEYGQALEHLIFLELRSYLSYRLLDGPLNFWRSQSKLEVDFVVAGRVAIEVKAAERVTDRAMRGLRALAEEVPLERKVIVSHEPAAWRSEDGIEVLPVDEFLQTLWQDKLL